MNRGVVGARNDDIRLHRAGLGYLGQFGFGDDGGVQVVPLTLGELVDAERLADLGAAGEAEALTDGTTSLTWSAYAERVARMAAALVDVGAAPGDRIAVHLSKSVESFVAVHAILRAGCVMVPVDPLAPTGVVAAVLADAGVDILVSDARIAQLGEIVTATGVRRVLRPRHDDEVGVPERVTTISRSLIESTPPGECVRVAGTDPAYIIYTSGSTGRPKGIVHTHRSALAYAVAAAESYGLTIDDRLANVAPLHFDQSTFELYAGPIAGSTVLVIPDPILRFPASLSTLLETQRVTVWYSVPYLLGQLSMRGVLEERDLSTIRWVLFGGESFPPGQLAELMGQLPQARFSNVYGPAEVNQCTIYNLAAPPGSDAAVPIGRPWPAARIAIVQSDDPDIGVDPGQPGELVVLTATMMAGYWGRPDLTAASIIERRSDGGESEHWYRTGDLVVEHVDGNLEFLGRIDNQIKLRGHRIELEAVDAALADIDLVHAGTAVVQRSQTSEDRLVAIVVAEPAVTGGAPDQLRKFEQAVMSGLRQRLPRYAVPSELVIVSGLPRTGTGKVDRGASLRLLES